MAWTGIGQTDKGCIRTSNQDAFAILNDLGIWVVADGMGGHAGGDVASQLAVATIVEQVHAHASIIKKGAEDCAGVLPEILQAAHQAILNKVRERPELKSMGTTVVVLHISSQSPSSAVLAHVGDSRAYLIRNRDLTPLTQDHSLVNHYIREGKLTPKEALTHPERHVLTRALGIGPQAKPEITTTPLQPGDRVLLCTDGLTKMIDDPDIAEIMAHAPQTLQETCQALVDEAMHWGGEDNVTVILCAEAPFTRASKTH